MSCHTSTSTRLALACFETGTGVRPTVSQWHQAADHGVKSTVRLSEDETVAAVRAMLNDAGITDADIDGSARLTSMLEHFSSGRERLTVSQAATMSRLAGQVPLPQAGGPYHDDAIPDLPAEGEPPRVILLRGLPGSGKSTWAKKVMAAYPQGAVARVNNDDLAQAIFGDSRGRLGGIRAAVLREALARPGVRMVLVDNTNLNHFAAKEIADAASMAGADFDVDDRFLSVPYEECLRRNNARDRVVPQDAMERLADAALKVRPFRPRKALKVEPYANDNPALPRTVIVDVDGTLALLGDRDPFDWEKVGEDTPNPAVVNMVQMLQASGANVIVMSGRDGSCRDATQAWLDKHVASGLTLHMRPAGDKRRDDEVKLELFNEHVRDKYRVDVVLDDRDQVIRLWRDLLKLPTFQVADGSF